MTNKKPSNKSPQPKPTGVNFSRLAEKLKRLGVPYRGPEQPLAKPLAEVAAGGYVMHSGVSPSSKPNSEPNSDEPDPHVDDAAMIEATAKHWIPIAAFAWNSSEKTGPGAVVMHRDDLPTKSTSTPTMQWFAAADIPKGDDFRTLMLQCDAQRQVVLIVVDEHGDQALMLEADEDHPTQPQCAATLDQNN